MFSTAYPSAPDKGLWAVIIVGPANGSPSLNCISTLDVPTF